MSRFDFTGKVVLIAGASRGIGEACAHGFAQHGATVICSSRKQADCEKVAEAIRAKGGKAVSAELHGPYFLSTKAFKMLKADGGGSIVNVASIDGLQPQPEEMVGAVLYMASDEASYYTG